jgi:hypothetical protein
VIPQTSAIDLQVSPSIAGQVKEQSLGRRACAGIDGAKRAIVPRISLKLSMVDGFKELENVTAHVKVRD